MKTYFSILAFLAIAFDCAVPTGTLRAVEPDSPLYIVLFRITIDTDSTLKDCRVAKIIDLLSGSNNPAEVELPQAFIDAAKRQIEAQHFKPNIKDGKPSETLTTFTYSPGAHKKATRLISLCSLDGAMNDTTSFDLFGKGCQASVFGKNRGRSAFFVTYYAVPLPRNEKEERESLVGAEIGRCIANIGGAEVLSRKDFSDGPQTIFEVVAKSPKNRSLSIRCRVICTSRQMLALTATTPDDQDADSSRAFDAMFAVFHFN